ncbi:WD40/YVTN/BNR-like repeat-containing protein [Hymenobacter nivis]|uniref:WD40/YVTN/BNR-like repeat-containing protein n=1 Tax=Hymenobacter nivis TaxID=1850093 RepID=UPI00112DD1DF|nr:hypothetical protein [Hymenobacter nivis]
MLLTWLFQRQTYLWLIVLNCLSSSCNSDLKRTEDNQNAHTALEIKPKSVRKPTSPDKAVYDLLPVNGDTLIAVKWNGGLAITTDAGLHWQNMHDQRQKRDFLYIKYLTIDQHHVLWGLDSWPGVHEPAYSRLAYSTDFGKTWTHGEFDTHTFFPYEFYSLPGKALRVLTYNGKVYQMRDRKGKKWDIVKTITELNNTVNDTVPGDSYSMGGGSSFWKQANSSIERKPDGNTL